MDQLSSGQLYLGRHIQRAGSPADHMPLLYDARDLTTHAVCLGMTGSGKTGLGVVLIEELALAGVPALIVDPKGEMGNLMLLFPDLLPADFRPWVDVEGARRQDIDLEAYARQVAHNHKAELARWNLDQERMARLQDRAAFALYTPGSDAGRPVSVVQSLYVPPLDWDTDGEILLETIASTVSALLALVGIESDPVTGREQILLSTIIEHAWRDGKDMDLAQLVMQVQQPPFEQLGVLPLEVFYPAKERTALMMALNGLLASPRFAMWRQGEPLDVESLMRAPDGRPQVSILALAHLEERERLFFITLLLEQVRAWLRLQAGTPHLRALLYIDELFGLMPPHPADPPTKRPLLALLKQARAQGLGVVVSTQNPVDLDYKGLSNAGTWFIGKLQTANDRQRVLEGLGGASLEAGLALDRAALDRQLANLDTRTFLLHNVHSDADALFQTRQTMSYLRGPLTRAQIRQLVSVQPAPPGTKASLRPSRLAAEPLAFADQVLQDEQETHIPPSREERAANDDLAAMPPVLPSEIAQYFIPVRVPIEWAIRSAEQDGQIIIYRSRQLVYRPGLYGRAQVTIDSPKYNVRARLTVSRVVPVPERHGRRAWENRPLLAGTDRLDTKPAQGALFAPLPAQLSNPRRLKVLEENLEDDLYANTTLELAYQPVLKLVAQPDEATGQFKRRCYDAIAERRDAEMAKLDKSYQAKIDRIEAQIRREERELDQDQAEFDARRREEMISAGESIVNLLARRRQSRMLSVASRKRRLTQQARAEIDESIEALDDLEGQLNALLSQLEQEQAEIKARWSQTAQEMETVELRPRKADILIEALGIAWLPYWDIVYDDQGQEKRLSLAAFETSGSERE